MAAIGIAAAVLLSLAGQEEAAWIIFIVSIVVTIVTAIKKGGK